MLAVLFAACVMPSVLSLGGCAVNPVTGRSDFVLMTEQDEIALGRKYHPEILKQYGAYDDPALQSYVQQVGERLAAQSHRSNLIYRFTVLDSSDVNAFALPGGYVYITRGLLAYLNSEAQLAAVLGHEIGHVTARHSVRQHSAATATGVLGSVLAASIGVQGAGDLFNILGTALVQGYGREHELESDRLGAEYLAHTGYDPHAMIEVIGVLKDQELFEIQQAKEEDREPRVYHGVFASHPANDQRLQEVVGAAAQYRSTGTEIVNRDTFLARIDGLTFGDSEREGIRRGNRFYHAPLNFGLSFPDGWKIDNLPDRIIARPRGAEAVLQLTTEDLNLRIGPQAFIRERMKVRELRNGEPIDHRGLPGYTGLTRANTPYGERNVRVTVLYYENRAYIFLGAAKDTNAPYAYDGAFLDTVRSFHPLTAEERQLARAQKLKTIRAGADTRLATLARSSPITNHPEDQLRLINGLYPRGEPAPGQLLKAVE